MNVVLLTHILQALEKGTEVRYEPCMLLPDAADVLQNFTLSTFDNFLVAVPHGARKISTGVVTATCSLPVRLGEFRQVIILRGKGAIKKITRRSEDIASRNFTYFMREVDQPVHNIGDMLGITLHYGFQNIELYIGRLLEAGSKLKHTRIEHSFDAQTISSEGKFNQLLVPSLGRFIRALHSHNRPGGRSNCQQARQQRLKIKDDVPQRVPARLAFDLPRRSNQHWRDNRDYQHNSPQNLKSLLNARRHLNPRQRHVLEVSHFSRESGRRLQPNLDAAIAVIEAGIIWKGCSA